MRRALIASVILVLLSTNALAGPKEDALTAYDKFFTSFTKGNHEEIIGQFAPDALFYGTSSTELVTAPEGVRAYFTRALTSPAEVKAQPLENTAVALSDNVVVISGKWRVERTLDGKTTVGGPLRNSVVMQKRGDRWLIVQFHNSPTPKPPAAVPAVAPSR